MSIKEKKAANQNLIEPLEFIDVPEKVHIDEWKPEEDDYIFKTVKGAILLDVSGFYGKEQDLNLDAFIMSSKRTYNNPKMRLHTIHYLNYFEKFYDHDRILPSIYCSLKWLIDYEAGYTKEAFFYDLEKYIMRGPVSYLIGCLTRDNYALHLTYRNKKNPALQYTDEKLVWRIGDGTNNERF